MEKRIYEIDYVQNNNDNVVYHERHTVPNADTAKMFNIVIRKFNNEHPVTDRIDAIHEISATDVKCGLWDLLEAWRNGTLVFTDEDAQYVSYAIEFLKEW